MSKFTIYTTETAAIAVSNQITTLIDLNQLASQTGLSKGRLSSALRGEYYSKHENPAKRGIPESEREVIRILHNAGFTQQQICYATGRSKGTVIRTVGKQPKEVTVANRIAGKKLARMKTENALRLIVEANPSLVMKKIG